MADLKARKNDLNFEPVKVAKFGELETERKSLLRDKGRSEKNKEELHTLLEVIARRSVRQSTSNPPL